MDLKKLFHYISYIQYPCMLVALFFCYRPLFNNLVNLWSDLNTGLVFMGLGISFSTLQDTSKTQNKISKRIFQDPKYAKRFLVVMAIQVIVFTSIGLFGFFQEQSTSLKELSYGFISIGIGIIGMLKSAAEMAEIHRKSPAPEPVQG